MNNKNVISLVISWIIVIICLPIFFINVVLITKHLLFPNEIPSIAGYKPFIVYSGSMEKEIPIGSIAIIKETEPKNLHEEDIIAFMQEDNTIVTHRIVDIKTKNNKTYYVTKGDNNSSNDQELVSSYMIEGKYLFSIAYIGYIAMFLKEPLGLTTVLLGIGLCFMICLFISDKRKNKENS